MKRKWLWGLLFLAAAATLWGCAAYNYNGYGYGAYYDYPYAGYYDYGYYPGYYPYYPYGYGFFGRDGDRDDHFRGGHWGNGGGFRDGGEHRGLGREQGRTFNPESRGGNGWGGGLPGHAGGGFRGGGGEGMRR
jgi:hypothetical protein